MLSNFFGTGVTSLLILIIIINQFGHGSLLGFEETELIVDLSPTLYKLVPSWQVSWSTELYKQEYKTGICLKAECLLTERVSSLFVMLIFKNLLAPRSNPSKFNSTRRAFKVVQATSLHQGITVIFSHRKSSWKIFWKDVILTPIHLLKNLQYNSSIY